MYDTYIKSEIITYTSLLLAITFDTCIKKLKINNT